MRTIDFQRRLQVWVVISTVLLGMSLVIAPAQENPRPQTEDASELQAAVASLPEGATKDTLKGKVNAIENLLSFAEATNKPSLHKEFKNSLQVEASDLVNLYLKLKNDERAKYEAAMGLAFLQADRFKGSKSANKAVYGFNDSYMPDTYPSVFANCASVAAVEVDDNAIGTASLIATNLVLTCRHCLLDEDKGRLPNESFKFVFTNDPVSSSARRYPLKRVVYEGANDSEDWALLEIGDVTNTPSGDGVKSLIVDADSDRRPAVNCAIYVVGFPGGMAKMVADSARVLIPPRLIATQLVRARLTFYGELEEAMSKSLYPDALAKDLTARFKNSFFPKDKEPEESDKSTAAVWEFRSELLAKPGIPVFAIDSDTFSGDSGAPVFDRKTGELIGLFSRGIPDSPRPTSLKAGILNHEEAIPVRRVLEAWKAAAEKPGFPDANRPERYPLAPGKKPVGITSAP